MSKKKVSQWSLATKAVQQQQAEIPEQQNTVIPPEQQSGKTAKREKITLYLTWEHLDRLDTMVSEYKRRMRAAGKRASMDHNKIMRMMIEKMTVEDLLS